jgi:hypothetical protein
MFIVLQDNVLMVLEIPPVTSIQSVRDQHPCADSIRQGVGARFPVGGRFSPGVADASVAS